MEKFVKAMKIAPKYSYISRIGTQRVYLVSTTTENNSHNNDNLGRLTPANIENTKELQTGIILCLTSIIVIRGS